MVSLTVSHTKVPKLYFYKRVHFLSLLSLSTVLIHQSHSNTKILTLIPLIPTPNLLHSHPYSPHCHSDYYHSLNKKYDLTKAVPLFFFYRRSMFSKALTVTFSQQTLLVFSSMSQYFPSHKRNPSSSLILKVKTLDSVVSDRRKL